MATLTRTNSRSNPVYKDYVNFLASYKGGKKEEENSDSGVSVKSFSSNSSTSSLSSDVPDFPKTCTPYNTFLENSKTKKFSSVSVKPAEEKTTMKSEIFIEIQPTKSVSEVSKMFENKPPPSKSSKMNSKISIFEKPKIADKPALRSPPPMITVVPPQFREKTPPPIEEIKGVPPPPPPMPPQESSAIEKLYKMSESNPPPEIPASKPPPPPPMMNTAPKLQATLTRTRGPQTKYSVSYPNGVTPNEIDRNDPLVKKLVYGTLRGLYGAYHDKASDMLATLPKNMVVKSNGVQDRIDQIAANGDLDKINGRVNPKLEQE